MEVGHKNCEKASQSATRTMPCLPGSVSGEIKLALNGLGRRRNSNSIDFLMIEKIFSNLVDLQKRNSEVI